MMLFTDYRIKSIATTHYTLTTSLFTITESLFMYNRLLSHHVS